jgi:hypothetical protein
VLEEIISAEILPAWTERDRRSKIQKKADKSSQLLSCKHNLHFMCFCKCSMFCFPPYGLFWYILLVYLRRMCILQRLSEVFYMSTGSLLSIVLFRSFLALLIFILLSLSFFWEVG